MKEVTRIITLRITEIQDLDDLGEMISKEEVFEKLKNAITDIFDVDDVVIDNVQDFIMDKEGE